MGPSPLGDGKQVRQRRRQTPPRRFNGAVASWRRKEPQETSALHESARASMGPSPLGDGKSGPVAKHFGEYIGLQWGRRLLATERRGQQPVTPGQPGLQWGRRLLATERRALARFGKRWGCFNGAVASWRRKGSPPRGAADATAAASMGPSPLGDGKSSPCALPGLFCVCFNGAVASWRRKACLRWIASQRIAELQWGRRLLATERRRVAPLFRQRRAQLQWGRRLLATERWQREGMLVAQPGLQWGRRLLATESRMPGSGHRRE